jgi:UDP-N-acetylglucosamine 2-epimerase
MKHCAAVIGNSSSGLIEAPSFNIPTVNIGNRQKGRLAGCTVVQTSDDIEEISKSIKYVIKSGFRKKCKSFNNPYGDGETSSKIISILRKISLENIIMKPFNDLDF